MASVNCVHIRREQISSQHRPRVNEPLGSLNSFDNSAVLFVLFCIPVFFSGVVTHQLLAELNTVHNGVSGYTAPLRDPQEQQWCMVVQDISVTLETTHLPLAFLPPSSPTGASNSITSTDQHFPIAHGFFSQSCRLNHLMTDQRIRTQFHLNHRLLPDGHCSAAATAAAPADDYFGLKSNALPTPIIGLAPPNCTVE